MESIVAAMAFCYLSAPTAQLRDDIRRPLKDMWIQEGNCSMGFFPHVPGLRKCFVRMIAPPHFDRQQENVQYRNDELLYEYLSSSFCTVSFLVDLARLLGNKRSLNYTMWYIAPARRNYTTFSSGSWPMLLDQEEVALRSKKHQASSSCLLLLVLHNGSCSCISDCKQAFIYYLIYYPTRITSYFIPKEIQRQWEMEESNMKDGRCAVVWYASVSFYVLTSAETFLKYRNAKVTTAPRTRGNWGNNQHGWITNFPSKKETFNPAWSHTNNLSEHCNYTYYCSRKRSTFLDKNFC